MSAHRLGRLSWLISQFGDWFCDQLGGISCHTGRHNCFFNKFEDGQWLIDAPVIKSPEEIYKK
jgi:hypothetical protein